MEQLRAWFLEIWNYVEEKGLSSFFENPKRIHNADEMILFLTPKGQKVLARKGDRIHNIAGNDDKECITALITANAAVESPPPHDRFMHMNVFKLM